MPAAHPTCRSWPGGSRGQKHSGMGGRGAATTAMQSSLRTTTRPGPGQPPPNPAATYRDVQGNLCQLARQEQKIDLAKRQALFRGQEGEAAGQHGLLTPRPAPRGGIQDKAATWCPDPLIQVPGQTASLSQQENRPRPPQAPQDKDPPPGVCWIPPKPGGSPGGTFRKPGGWGRALLSDLHI